MKRNLLRLAFLTSAASLALAAGACGAKKDHNHPGQAGQPETPPTGAKPTDGPPSTGSPNQQADGSITSGGGYVYGYEANPWFIGNTATVRYCVDMDEANFGTSRDAAEKAIETAIGNWKDALKNAEFGHHQEEPLGTLVLGTQDFVKFDCAAEGIDIRFQLGKLSPDQTRKLGNPVKYVASAVQTSYDEENMRGAGFIYVAPEHGALKPDADDVADNFWTIFEGLNLEVVLTHEMGHVFGLSHQNNSIMGATTCEDVITNKTAKNWETTKPYLPMFGVSNYHDFLRVILAAEFKHTTGQVYISPYELKRIFGINLDITPEQNSAIMVLENNKLIIYSQFQSSEPPYLSTRGPAISTFEVSSQGGHTDSFTEIRIPRKQKVMKIPSDAFSDAGYLGGSYQSLDLLEQSFVYLKGYVIDPVTNKKTSVSAQTTDESSIGGGLSVDVIVDGRIEHLD